MMNDDPTSQQDFLVGLAPTGGRQYLLSSGGRTRDRETLFPASSSFGQRQTSTP